MSNEQQKQGGIYVVAGKDGKGERLVRAYQSIGAIKFVALDTLTVRKASPEDIYRLASEKVEIEDATKEAP